MARPLWKGSISFGLVNIPVGLYPAEKREEELHFNYLDSSNRARIRYQKVNEVTGEEVPAERIVRGYEFDEGNYVLLSDEDFKRADVEATQTIDIQSFVDRDSVDYVFFDKPYYLLPGKKGEKGYVLLREALRRAGKIGIARVVIRTREYLAALIPEGKALVLELLRYAHELRNTAEFEFPKEDIKDYDVSDREMKMAENLVEAMFSEWKPEQYHDKYRDALMSWIKKKIEAGQTDVTPEVPAAAEKVPGKVVDLTELLKRSVETRARREGEKKKAEKAPPAAQSFAKRKKASGE